MQSYKTGQVGGRASQVGGIACIVKVNERGVGSPQSIHTILVLTLNYHVFLTTIAFRNTYPNQPYTSHALHALSWLKRAI